MTPNTIDTLFQRMDEINAKSAEELLPSDIATVIAYHRQQRSRRAAGEKFTKPKEKSTVDISAILGAITPKPTTAAAFKRKL